MIRWRRDAEPQWRGLHQRQRGLDDLANREAVNHSVREFARDTSYSNGIEPSWPVRTRGCQGT